MLSPGGAPSPSLFPRVAGGVWGRGARCSPQEQGREWGSFGDEAGSEPPHVRPCTRRCQAKRGGSWGAGTPGGGLSGSGCLQWPRCRAGAGRGARAPRGCLAGVSPQGGGPVPPPCPAPPLRPPGAEGPCVLRIARILLHHQDTKASNTASTGGFAAAPDHVSVGMGTGTGPGRGWHGAGDRVHGVARRVSGTQAAPTGQSRVCSPPSRAEQPPALGEQPAPRPWALLVSPRGISVARRILPLVCCWITAETEKQQRNRAAGLQPGAGGTSTLPGPHPAPVPCQGGPLRVVSPGCPLDVP